MTPTSPSAPRKSGNPATQARLERAAALQREQDAATQRTEAARLTARRKRTRLGWWAVGIVGGLIVVGTVAASLVLAPKPATYDAGSDGAKIDGVKTFDNETKHVETPITYPQTPPAGGPHSMYWLNCGIYDQPQPNENAVHSLEHGAIWVTYDATTVSGDDLATLKTYLPRDYVILSPYEGLPSPIVVSAWNAQLKIEKPNDPRIAEFFEEYWRSQNVPEPGAACTGAIDGPGKQ